MKSFFGSENDVTSGKGTHVTSIKDANLLIQNYF